MRQCKSIGCGNPIASQNTNDRCDPCSLLILTLPPDVKVSLSAKYPKYFKDVHLLDEVDVYQVHDLFQIQDCSGAIQHASKKLLLSGVRTGGKTKFQDIQEARDTLNRWLQINAPSPEI